MSCCGGNPAAYDICGVCGQLKQVKWCELCKAYLCDTCRVNPLARARAAIQKQIAEIF